MPSGITRDLGAGRRVVEASADQQLVDERVKRLGLSPRQIELNRLYSYYRTQQHDDCVNDWDGSPHADTLMRASIVASPSMPVGYQDISGGLDPVPLRFRRPSVPCNLVKVIVSRFTSLLFSEQQNPTWKVEGDPQTEDWIQSVSDTYGLWECMAATRDLGGGMGTGIPGFKIINGAVEFETFDARWCFPTFDPKKPTEMVKLEIRYMYPKDVQDPETREWTEEKFWYLRIIDQNTDCLWKPQPVGDGSAEPDWANPANVADLRRHEFGFVPVEWIPNQRVAGDIDGDPDCLGCYDYVDRIGEIDSQCHGGAVRNADPTPVIGSDGTMSNVRMGSKNAVKLEKGGTMAFAETSGAAIQSASTESDRLEAKVLRTAECVLPDQESTEGGPATATEIHKRTGAMHAKASRLRTQYGNHGAIPLMQKIIKVARKLAQGKPAVEGDTDERGQPVAPGMTIKGTIKVPPKFEDGKLTPRVLGNVEGAQLKLMWPPFSEPSPQDTVQIAQATALLVTSGIITKKTATRKVAPHYDIEDVNAEVAQAEKEKPKMPADLGARSLTELNQGR